VNKKEGPDVRQARSQRKEFRYVAISLYPVYGQSSTPNPQEMELFYET